MRASSWRWTRSSFAMAVLLVVAQVTASLAGHSSTALAAESEFDSAVRRDFAFSDRQLTSTDVRLPSTAYPIDTNDTGAWNTTRASAWTSGFFPGSLWLMYQRTADPAWRARAEAWQAGIEPQKYNTSTHDLGFMLFNSFGNAYRLTGKDRYRQVVLAAAKSVASRYSPTVGCIKSWESGPADYKVIIDNMMNLELLFWASRNGGNRAWRDMAVSHALKTRLHHVRTDGSTYHLVNYDPATGAVKSKGTVQGYSDQSTWSRGQAWAVYGFAMAYRETRDSRFLDTARRTADYFIGHLPADKVPYWDFNAPSVLAEPRDSSAAAIAASGLLDLARLETDPVRRSRYLTAAKGILASLSSTAYLAEGTPGEAILLHGTYNRPRGKFDTGLVWGDYYFLEALLRYRWIMPASPLVAVTSVSASSHDGNVPSNTLDNNLSTRWSAYGDGQWVRFDLGARKSVGKVAIAWHRGDARTARFDIQTSADGVRWGTAYRGISSGMTTRQETYDFTDRSTRYVRIVGHGNSANPWNSITEVDIYAS